MTWERYTMKCKLHRNKIIPLSKEYYYRADKLRLHYNNFEVKYSYVCTINESISISKNSGSFVVTHA